jgi:hypothetical protein
MSETEKMKVKKVMSLCGMVGKDYAKKGSLGNDNKASESDYVIIVGMGVKMHAATAVFDWFKKQCHTKHSNLQFILSNKLSKNLNTS